MQNSIEDDRLNEAMRRGDDLLVGSLKREEQQRTRKRVTIALTALAAACLFAGILWSRMRGRPASLPESAPLALSRTTSSPTPSTAQPSFAEKLLTLTDDWRRAL